MNPSHNKLKILVAIASYGTNNDQYLQQLINEYAGMPYQVDIFVVSNIAKDLGENIEVVVGLPIKNPWSLPFAHKKIFVERVDQYDLFIYSEDDTLITQQNIEAFLQASSILKPDEIAGFLRTEQDNEGNEFYSTVHSHYHWDVSSVCQRGNEVFAFFTNEHGACYILTQKQLRQAIASGEYNVQPYEGKYDMLVTAATDPYTRCGFRKLICLTRLENFTCKHLTNKYIGKTGLEKSKVDIQKHVLIGLLQTVDTIPEPIQIQCKLPGTRWIKSYYEACRDDLIKLMPKVTKRVLSIGCGWGKTEAALVTKKIQVTAIPLDIVIGKLAENQGIRIISESLTAAPKVLFDEKFDVVLISGLLHLVEDPVALLHIYRNLLTDDGVVILSCPNMHHISIMLRKLRGQSDLAIKDFQSSGVHNVSSKVLKNWLTQADFLIEKFDYLFVDKWKLFNRISFGLLANFWAEEFIIKAYKK